MLVSSCNRNTFIIFNPWQEYNLDIIITTKIQATHSGLKPTNPSKFTTKFNWQQLVCGSPLLSPSFHNNSNPTIKQPNSIYFSKYSSHAKITLFPFFIWWFQFELIISFLTIIGNLKKLNTVMKSRGSLRCRLLYAMDAFKQIKNIKCRNLKLHHWILWSLHSASHSLHWGASMIHYYSTLLSIIQSDLRLCFYITIISTSRLHDFSVSPVVKTCIVNSTDPQRYEQI